MTLRVKVTGTNIAGSADAISAAVTINPAPPVPSVWTEVAPTGTALGEGGGR